MADAPVVGSPEWWVKRLVTQIDARQPRITRLANYYAGDHPLPDLPEKAKAAFRRLLKASRANFVGLVADATAERLQVDGFRFGGDRTGDSAAWRIWQANGLDAESELAIADAVALSRSALLVWPNDADEDTPTITIEHASQFAIECEPGNRRKRAAALKMWLDDWTGLIMTTLYLPQSKGGVYKYVSTKKPTMGETSIEWKPREVADETWPLRNPFGELIPMVELPNRPSTLTGPRSEFEDVIDIQDRIDKTIADRLMAQEYGAFRQKWVTGMEIPEDDEGNAVEPFDVAVNRILMAEEKEAQFGSFDATDLGPYVAAAEADVAMLASITKTPPHYLLNRSGQPVSGDALKAAEAGLIAKVRKRMRHFGEGFEEVMRLAFLAAGDEQRADDIGAETIWRNPEFRTEGELVDALVKMRTLGVPLEALYERWGASQTEIARWTEQAQTDDETDDGPDADLPDGGEPVDGLPQPDGGIPPGPPVDPQST